MFSSDLMSVLIILSICYTRSYSRKLTLKPLNVHELKVLPLVLITCGMHFHVKKTIIVLSCLNIRQVKNQDSLC